MAAQTAGKVRAPIIASTALEVETRRPLARLAAGAGGGFAGAAAAGI